jgi:hypothetical protein
VIFGSFLNYRSALKGQGFADIADIQRNMTKLLQGILENDFQDCFWKWHHRLTNCTASQAEHLKAVPEASSAPIGKFCFHKGILAITLLHDVF